MDLAESGIQPQDFAYCYEFIASGCVGLFQVWVENGMQEPPEAIARLTERLILQESALRCGQFQILDMQRLDKAFLL